MDQARSRWEGGEGINYFVVLEWVLVGAYYLEDVGYHFVRGDVAVVFEEGAGLWTDGLEVGLVPLHVLVLCFDLGVYFRCGHAGEGEGRGAKRYPASYRVDRLLYRSFYFRK